MYAALGSSGGAGGAATFPRRCECQTYRTKVVRYRSTVVVTVGYTLPSIMPLVDDPSSSSTAFQLRTRYINTKHHSRLAGHLPPRSHVHDTTHTMTLPATLTSAAHATAPPLASLPEAVPFLPFPMPPPPLALLPPPNEPRFKPRFKPRFRPRSTPTSTRWWSSRSCHCRGHRRLRDHDRHRGTVPRRARRRCSRWILLAPDVVEHRWCTGCRVQRRSTN